MSFQSLRESRMFVKCNFSPNSVRRITIIAFFILSVFLFINIFFEPDKNFDFGRYVIGPFERLTGKNVYKHNAFREAYSKGSNFSTRSINTTCSEEVVLLGNHQKIIAFSYLGLHPGYLSGGNQIMESISRYYPGWKVRIYATGSDIVVLKLFMKKWNFVYYCDVDHLPPPIYTGRPYPVTLWRYAPMGDPQVDVALFRDIDSDILPRELDAVTDWLKSNKTLHIMRDHPNHNVLILAGMWGVKMNAANRELLRKLRDRMFELTFEYSRPWDDQPYLKKVLWPVFKRDSIAHDSYYCKKFPNSFPWPTQRNIKKNYVGGPIFPDLGSLTVPKKCPVECRPKDHLDWEYC